MNKKADTGLTMNKLITLFIIAIVIIVVAIGSIKYGKDIFDKIKTIFPGFNQTAGNNELIQPATILNIKTNVLLNDGEGRCIVYEEKNPLIKDYGIRENKLWRFENGKWIDIDTTANLDDNQMTKCEAVQKLIADEKELMQEIKDYYYQFYNDVCIPTFNDPSNYIDSEMNVKCGFLKELFEENFFSSASFKDIESIDDDNLKSEIYFLVQLIIKQDESLKNEISFSGKLNILMLPAGNLNQILSSTLDGNYATNGKEIYTLSGVKWIEIEQEDHPYLFIEGCSKTNKQIKADLFNACYVDEK
ncbi:MAG: hypothetical protein WC438_02115 [Candidatus Pacearchaeota archaeon]